MTGKFQKLGSKLKVAVTQEWGRGGKRQHIVLDETEKMFSSIPTSWCVLNVRIGMSSSGSTQQPGCVFEGTEVQACTKIPGKLKLKLWL